MSRNQRGRPWQGHEGQDLAKALSRCCSPGVVLIDAGQKCISLTTEAKDLLGLDADFSVTGVEALPAALKRLASEAAASGKPVESRQLELGLRGGSAVTLRVSAMPQPGKAGTVLVLREGAESSEWEARINHLNRLANTGTLAASMAHEIRNALVAGRTFFDLLLEKHQDSELVEVARRELGRIDAMVSRMLRFASPEKAAYGRINVHEVLEHSLRLVQPQIKANSMILEQSFRAAPDRLDADEYELEQAFVNLLLNALEAMHPEGTLAVTTETIMGKGDDVMPGQTPPRTAAGSSGGSASLAGSSGAAALRETAEPAHIWIRISDTGAGIAPEDLKHIFEPFFTTKPSGTGLGLAITRRIIEEHGGAISVESRQGQGTTFVIRLAAAG